MPGPECAGKVVFYEDFPYAWWNDFKPLEDLPRGRARGLPDERQHLPDVRRHQRPARAQDHAASRMYESQIERLFDGTQDDGRRGPRVRAGGRRARAASTGRRAVLGDRAASDASPETGVDARLDHDALAAQRLARMPGGRGRRRRRSSSGSVLPADRPGLRDDIDQFVGWVHHIATTGWRRCTAAPTPGRSTFGPVMAYVWAIAGRHPAGVRDRRPTPPTRSSGR